MKNFTRTGLLLLLVLAVWLYTKRSRTIKNEGEKVLTTVSTANIKTLDPTHTTDVYSQMEVSKVYEGLYEYHYLKDPCELVPNLAAAMPVISADGHVYTIKLNQGVKFHDNPCFPEGRGREMIAEDLVYSLKRVADPKVQSPRFSELSGRIQGLDAWRKQCINQGKADYAVVVEGLKALDKYTLQITLTKPWPQLLYHLATAYTYAVPKEAVAYYGQEFLNHPVGTGPFVLQAFNPQLNKLVYHKNPTFRDKYFPSEASEKYQHMLADAGKKLPLVDKVITHILPEEQPRWLKFQQGAIDILNISADNIALEVVEKDVLAPYLQKKGIHLFQEPAQAVGYYVFNNSHPLFKNNLKLRQAMSLAFDREKYQTLFSKGTAILAQSLIPPGMDGHVKGYMNPYNVYNLAKAKQLLAEAGYPEGKGLPTISLDCSATNKQRQQAEFFQQCMKNIGIKIKLVPQIFPELVTKIKNKQTMMHAIACALGAPDAADVLALLYSGKTIGSGFYFEDAEYDALFEKTLTMQPSPARTSLYEKLYRLAAEKVPGIYTTHPQERILYHGWVKNYRWSSFHYGNEQYVDIDLEARKTLEDKF